LPAQVQAQTDSKSSKSTLIRMVGKKLRKVHLHGCPRFIVCLLFFFFSFLFFSVFAPIAFVLT